MDPSSDQLADARVADRLTVIAIDGPAGSGKSTVARRLATALGLDFLDTGAMYRSVTHAALAKGLEPDASDAVAELARATTIELDPDGTVLVDGANVTRTIRSPEVSRAVSAVAANPEVRAELVANQRHWAKTHGGGVLEGRDIGTVVFPSAILKVYLTASVAARAARRAIDEETEDRAAVEADLERRDRLDSGRASDPLRQAEDAFVLDTTDLTIDEVVERLVTEVRDRMSTQTQEQPLDG